MKAFEEWWVNQFKQSPTEIQKPLAIECAKIAVKSWKAALEWVQKEAMVDYNEYDEKTGYLILDIEDIEKELEN